jgi:hypothetical protein
MDLPNTKILLLVRALIFGSGLIVGVDNTDL